MTLSLLLFMNNLANRKVAGHVSANTESLHFTVDIHSRQHKSLKLTEFVEHSAVLVRHLLRFIAVTAFYENFVKRRNQRGNILCSNIFRPNWG